MNEERQFAAQDAVEPKQTGDVRSDKTVTQLTEEALLGAVGGGDAVRTTGVDEVGLLTENRQPNNPPTGGA
jgi:hypothetical protein